MTAIEQTLSIIKPDAVKNKHTGLIYDRIIKADLSKDVDDRKDPKHDNSKVCGSYWTTKSCAGTGPASVTANTGDVYTVDEKISNFFSMIFEEKKHFEKVVSSGRSIRYFEILKIVRKLKEKSKRRAKKSKFSPAAG